MGTCLHAYMGTCLHGYIEAFCTCTIRGASSGALVLEDISFSPGGFHVMDMHAATLAFGWLGLVAWIELGVVRCPHHSIFLRLLCVRKLSAVVADVKKSRTTAGLALVTTTRRTLKCGRQLGIDRKGGEVSELLHLPRSKDQSIHFGSRVFQSSGFDHNTPTVPRAKA